MTADVRPSGPNDGDTEPGDDGLRPEVHASGCRWRRGDLEIDTDRGRLDLDVVHGFLATSYWATGITRELVARSIAGSMPFGVYAPGGRQVGFARAITDAATYAYVADVFVLDDWQGRGIGTWLIRAMLTHPDLQGLRRWSLVTRDAHEVYRRAGFELVAPERWMELRPPR